MRREIYNCIQRQISFHYSLIIILSCSNWHRERKEKEWYLSGDKNRTSEKELIFKTKSKSLLNYSSYNFVNYIGLKLTWNNPVHPSYPACRVSFRSYFSWFFLEDQNKLCSQGTSFHKKHLASVASVRVRQKSFETIFRKLAARKLGQETEGTHARRPPIFEKPVRPQTGASDWCGTVAMIDRWQIFDQNVCR